MARRWATVLCGCLVLGVLVRESGAQTITTVAGNGTNGYSGDGGAATSAQLRPGTGGSGSPEIGRLLL